MARDTLTKEQIVGAAIALLDEEGLDGLNMRSLGQRLDSAATAMYWHVKNKDNLVRLAVDEVWGEIALPDPAATDWRAAAEAMATGMYTVLARHPWLVQAQASHLLYGPNKSRHDERALAIFEAAGFDDDDADRAVAAIFLFVLGNATGPAANVSLRRRLGKGGADPETQLAQAMTEATAIAGKFPRLRARIERAAGTGYNAAPDSTFRFGLAALLDGLGARTAS
ncbi:TetR/AcrR family transcriptional regulator C-terminal domain-containing protein [Nocardia neocaledoniensis]|uniref:TetR/AcrR family transcriptional regulator C-terminal domain-containing protein n=1 Tax=Nocardia neocaledoniensis TaxID=236511 RepID=UPI000D708F8B|nr:TetR/AcrR family transcriptional regulator C-terminal domain-containing protein [Nocardia neocaledoniensis]